MAEYGADVHELRTLAKQFTDIASTLEETIRSLSVRISNSAAWRGPDADRFRSQWNTTDTARLRSTSQAITVAADTLRRNASEQESTSAAATGTTVATGLTVCSEPSVSTKSLFEKIDRDDHNRDGVHIEKITGSDGVDRYVVYVEGTGGAGDGNGFNPANRLNWADNTYKVTGLPDPYLLGRMSRIPHGAEIMMVGYSQGGIDAQTIAATGLFNVTDVVTFGAPRLAGVAPETMGANLLTLSAEGDPVPSTAAASMIVLNPITTATNLTASVFNNDQGTVQNFTADAAGDRTGVDLHSNGETYRSIGEQFDRSTDPRFDTIRQSMARYQGSSTNHD